MNITPINNVPFGIKIKTKEHLTSPISKRTIDEITLRNGNKVIISTNYFQNKPTDRLIKAFNYVGRLIDTKLKCYDAEGKVCLHFTTKN